MSKYGIKEVLDVAIYDKDGMVMVMDTMKSATIEYGDNHPRMGKLILEDALVDEAFLNDVLNDKFRDRYLRIVGETTFRKVDDGCDYNVVLNITVAKLNKYSVHMCLESVTVPYLEFDFPLKDHYGFQNGSITVKDKV